MVKCVGPTLEKKDIAKLAEETQFMPNLDELSAALCIVGNPNRLKIFYLLAELNEVCVCDLAAIMDHSIPGISQHLAKMKSNGLLKSRRKAQTIYYSLNQSAYNESIKQLLVRHLGDEASREEN